MCYYINVNMMRILLLAVITSAAVAPPPAPEEENSFRSVQLGPVLFPGQNRSVETVLSPMNCDSATRNTGVSCKKYCQELAEHFFDGECVDGKCLCKEQSKCSTDSCDDFCKTFSQEGRCVKNKCVCEDFQCKYFPSTNPENDKSCESFCEGKGRCVQGKCKCG